MSDVYNVLIIGGSFAGLTAAHHLLRNIFPTLTSTGLTYRVTILTPASKFLHRISAPRALINPHLQNLDAGLKDIAPGLSQYGDRAGLVIGKATSIDDATKSVLYEGTEGNASGRITYDSLIIASGADSDDPYWGITCGTNRLRAAYEDIHNRIENAKTILIAGGGPIGVETAGEIVHRFGRSKDVTLLSGTTRLLAGIDNQQFGIGAEEKLRRKGIKVVHQVRVTSVETTAGHTTLVNLDNGDKLEVDIYIPSSGLKPNSAFVPAGWLDGRKQVKCDSQTFRLDVPGITNVYAFGSVASYSDGTLFDVKFAYKALGQSFKVDRMNTVTNARVKDSPYSKWQQRNLQLTPLGQSDGVVIVLGWRLPGFLCVLIKSRTFFIEQTPEFTHGKGV